MSNHQRTTWLARCTIASVCALGLLGAAPQEPVLQLDLDGSLTSRAGGRSVTAQFGQEAKFIESAEGQGIEPGPEGPAVVVPVPDELWRPAGTLAFRIRPSRTLRIYKDGKLNVDLVKCPLFTLGLMEFKRHIVLRASMAHDGSEKDRKVLGAATRGQLYWSHLKGGKWYHVAVAWDAAKGRFDVFLSGSIQQELRLRRRWQPWRPPAKPSGNLEIGGTLGEGDAAAKIAVDSIQLYPAFMDEACVAATLKGRPNFALTNEGRWDFEDSLDLSPYKLALLYETEFDKPLNWIHEDDLFDGEKRVRTPEGKDWVLGARKAARPRSRTVAAQS